MEVSPAEFQSKLIGILKNAGIPHETIERHFINNEFRKIGPLLPDGMYVLACNKDIPTEYLTYLITPELSKKNTISIRVKSFPLSHASQSLDIMQYNDCGPMYINLNAVIVSKDDLAYLKKLIDEV
jgi:hypothetical protein